MAGIPLSRGLVQRAQKMRKAGHTYIEIQNKLGISRASVTTYTSDIVSHRSQPVRGQLIIPQPDPLLTKLIEEHPKHYAKYSKVSSKR